MPGKLRDVSVKPLYGKAVGKILLLVGAFLFVTAVSGSDVPMKVFDFEIEDERAALSDKRGHGFIGFKKAYPCSGEWTLAFNPSSWKPGMNGPLLRSRYPKIAETGAVMKNFQLMSLRQKAERIC